MKTGHVLTLVLSLSAPLRAFADTNQPGYGHDWGMMHWGTRGMMFMMPVMFLLVIAVVAAGIFMIRRVGGSDRREGPFPQGDTALEILKKRYARGEIDREEFERMKRELES